MNDDCYDNKSERSGINMKARCFGMVVIFVLFVVALMYQCAKSCGIHPTVADTIIVKTTDTVTIVERDTVPQVRTERVVKYIPVPAILSAGNAADTTAGTGKDSLAVVQKEYTDDSTYTAWVSGIGLDGYPKLDSIQVKRQIITERIRETVTNWKQQSHWKFGFQAGYGYGLRSNQFEPYVGFGIGYDF